MTKHNPESVKDIVAVVEAAKEYATAIERNDECDASVVLCEAVRKWKGGRI